MRLAIIRLFKISLAPLLSCTPFIRRFYKNVNSGANDKECRKCKRTERNSFPDSVANRRQPIAWPACVALLVDFRRLKPWRRSKSTSARQANLPFSTGYECHSLLSGGLTARYPRPWDRLAAGKENRIGWVANLAVALVVTLVTKLWQIVCFFYTLCTLSRFHPLPPSPSFSFYLPIYTFITCLFFSLFLSGI